jgi:hypothetical protein
MTLNPLLRYLISRRSFGGGFYQLSGLFLRKASLLENRLDTFIDTASLINYAKIHWFIKVVASPDCAPPACAQANSTAESRDGSHLPRPGPGRQQVRSGSHPRNLQGVMFCNYPTEFSGAPGLTPGTYAVIWRERNPRESGKWRVLDVSRVKVPKRKPARHRPSLAVGQAATNLDPALHPDTLTGTYEASRQVRHLPAVIRFIY